MGRSRLENHLMVINGLGDSGDLWGLDLANASAHLTSAYEIVAGLSSQRSDPFGGSVSAELEYAAISAFSALAALEHCSETLWLRGA
jgi:hypothetical protein